VKKIGKNFETAGETYKNQEQKFQEKKIWKTKVKNKIWGTKIQTKIWKQKFNIKYVI
jgi:hypothetical protein